MLLKDYVNLLKKYYKKPPSDPDLCMELFNSVLYNIDDDDTFYDYDKSVVSRVLSGNRKIPSPVRNHVYDESVEEGIADYFADNIVTQLIPEHSDLIYEMVSLLENYPNISKPHLSTLKALAKDENLSIFLSEIFRFAVIEGKQDTAKDDDNITASSEVIIPSEKEPVLTLCGISKEDYVTDAYIIEELSNKTEVSKKLFKEKLQKLYDEISDIHLEQSSGVFTGLYSFRKKVEIEKNTRTKIEKVAEIFVISMSDDFFDLGNLEENTLSSAAILGRGLSLEGLPEEKQKYELITKTEKVIDEMLEAAPFINNFEGVKCIRFAVMNSGTMHDENISIDLKFPKGSLLTMQDIAKMDQKVYDYIMYGADFDNFFGISRGNNYLDYESSVKQIKPHPINIQPNLAPFGYSVDVDESDREEELKDCFGYFISSQGEEEVVNVKYDEIVHHDAVAFPSVILIKKDVTKIKYSIHSKYMAEKVEGERLWQSKD